MKKSELRKAFVAALRGTEENLQMVSFVNEIFKRKVQRGKNGKREV